MCRRPLVGCKLPRKVLQNCFKQQRFDLDEEATFNLDKKLLNFKNYFIKFLTLLDEHSDFDGSTTTSEPAVNTANIGLRRDSTEKSIKKVLTKGDNNTDGIGTSNEDDMFKDEEIQKKSISILFLQVILIKQIRSQFIKKISYSKELLVKHFSILK